MATIAEALQAALDHHQAGRGAEARVLYGRILAAAPDTADAHYLLGMLDAQEGRFAEAAAGLQRAVDLRPQSLPYRLNLAKALSAGGQVFSALHQFRAVLAQQPDQAEALTAAARLLLDGVPEDGQDRAAEAADLFDRAARLLPIDAALALDQARCLQRLDRLTEAAVAAARAVAHAPTPNRRAAAHILLARVLEAQGRTEEALAAYEAGLPDADPALAPQAHQARGALLQAAGRSAEALPAYRAALDLQPDLLPARFGLGQVLNDLGRDDPAADCFQQVLDRDPGQIMAYEALAQLRARQGRPDLAADILAAALAVDPGRADLRFAWGRHLQADQRPGPALAAYAAVVADGTVADDMRAAAACNRALLLVAEGDLAGAAELLPLVTALRPGEGAEGEADCRRLATLLSDLALVRDDAWDHLGRLIAWIAAEWRVRGYFWKTAYYVALETGNRLLDQMEDEARRAIAHDALRRLVETVVTTAIGIDPLLDPWFVFLEGCVALRLGEGERARALFAGLAPALPFTAHIPFGDDFARWTAEAAAVRGAFAQGLTWGPLAPGAGHEPVVLVAADSAYVRRFLPVLAASIASAAPGARLHVHVCDPVPGDIDFIRAQAGAAPALRLGWSTEVLDAALAGPSRTTYLTAARFLRLPDILERYAAPLVVADIDAAFLTDPARFVAALDAGRPVATTWGPGNLAGPYDAAGGGLVVLADHARARDFARGVADFLLYHVDRARRHGVPLGYFLDQVALIATINAVLKPAHLRPIPMDGRVHRLGEGPEEGAFVQILPEKAMADFDERMARVVARLRTGEGPRPLEEFFRL